jgi:hypothetical protein
VLASVSIAALCISLFTYFDNRQRTKIIEKHEHTKEKTKQAREILLETAKHFKQLPEAVNNIAWLDFTVNDILRLVSEQNHINLRITVKYIEIFWEENEKIYHHEIENAYWLRHKLEKPFLKLFEGKTQYYPNPMLILEVDPATSNDSWELGDFLKDIVKIKHYHMKLKEYAQTIESFDNSVLDDITTSYEKIFDAFYEAMKKKSYEFQFGRQTKASEIEKALYDIVGVTSITGQLRYLSKEVAIRLEKLTGELFKYEYPSP